MDVKEKVTAVSDERVHNGSLKHALEVHLHFMVYKKTDKYECGHESIKINWKDNLSVEKIDKGKWWELTFTKNN